MKIICHRGFWSISNNPNSIESFELAIRNGFGIETDVRDFKGKLVISHDPPLGEEIYFEDLLTIKSISKFPLAINIKSDGLSLKVKDLLEAHSIKNYFCFDMSVPDTLSYFKQNVTTFIRVSEYESLENQLITQSAGIWLDSFQDNWFVESDLKDFNSHFKSICIVSSELHGRDPQPLWEILQRLSDRSNISLCTDLPLEAKEFFGV